MAVIQDHTPFKIKVTPQYTNWWTFSFEFFYQDKPLFNPEISDGVVFAADEYESYPLLPVLEKATGSKTDDEHFGWGAWEDEVEVDIVASMKNLEKWNEDGGFHFTVFVSERLFKGREMNYGFVNAGVKLFVNRDELKKFYNDLKIEMASVVHSLTPPREISGSQPLAETKTVKIDDLNLNTPFKHERLIPSLIERITNFKQILAEVETMPIQVTVDNFRKDTHPEREIEVWESIARLYKDALSNNPSMTLEQKKKAYSDLLSGSMESNPVTIKRHE